MGMLAELFNRAAANPLAFVLIGGSTLIALGVGGFFLFGKVLPKETILPILVTVFLHCATYFFVRLLPLVGTYHNLSNPLDDRIPFWPPMIVIYILAFVQWAANWILLSRQPQALRTKVLSAETIAKLICMLVFIFFPTTLTRPSVSADGNGFERIVCWIYGLDAPTNLLPSVHCLESWVCIRVALKAEWLPKWYLPFTIVFSTLVVASTLLVKQHVLIDIPTAILAAEAGFLLSRLVHADRPIKRYEDWVKHRANAKVVS